MMQSMQNIILAAGLGTRSNGEKLFFPWKGKTIIEQVVEQSLQANLDTIVVTGFQKERVELALRKLKCDYLHFVFNEHYLEGQFTSTQCGAAHLALSENFNITVGDLPLIEAKHYQILAHQLGTYDGVRPRCQGKPGHPVLLTPLIRPFILQAEKTQTMKQLLQQFNIKAYATNDSAYITDIDTAQALEEIIKK